LAVALILAAGYGERLGAQRPKALVELAGRPLLHWSIQALRGVAAIERIVVALPPGVKGQELTRGLDVGVGGAGGVIAVAGGAVRSESVRLALAAAGGSVGMGEGAGKEGSAAAGGGGRDLVLVHDAARPLLTAELIESTLAAALGEGVDAAVAATPVTDTVKRVGADRVVSETLERSSLWAVQTPQVFRRAVLERALDVPDDVLAQATDDAWLVERAGGTVVVVPASRENLKVTSPLDLALAEMLFAQRRARSEPRFA
jgi:2-C-methyl-D-erythritol 4-phosphate cytidylyltransferase